MVTAMKMITFTDFTGAEIEVRSNDIESVRHPGQGVHDHGSLTLHSGRRFDFRDDSTSRRIVEEMAEFFVPLPTNEGSMRELRRIVEAHGLEAVRCALDVLEGGK